MEKFKIAINDPITFAPHELETKIPKEIVEQIQTLLNNFNKTNWTVMPLMIEKEGSNVSFNIKNNELNLKYIITIAIKNSKL